MPLKRMKNWKILYNYLLHNWINELFLFHKSGFKKDDNEES